MNTHVLRLRAVGVTAVLALVAGCGPKPTDPAQLAQDKQALQTCPKDKKVAAKVALDASGSGRTPELSPEHTAAITSVARRTAICGGRLKVNLFSATSAATVTLYDEEVILPGATDNARLHHVQKAVDEAIRRITEGYKPALEKLSPNGSDVLAEYQDAAAYIKQRGTGYRLELLILSDGYQATGNVNLGGNALTQAQATALAARLNVPKLPGASVTVAGIGRVAAGKPASSAVVEGTIRFWDAVCARAQAEECLSVTDLSVEGR